MPLGCSRRCSTSWPDESGLAREILLAEQEGDRITHDIVRRVNTTSVTPIDGEDIYALATQVDDIVDFTEETADFLASTRSRLRWSRRRRWRTCS